MLTRYIDVAMNRAHYEILSQEEGYLGRIEELRGVWANSETLEACRQELREVLEEWIIVGMIIGQTLPKIGGISLRLREGADITFKSDD